MANPDILDTLAKIRKDPKLVKEFTEKPEATLKGMGVDTSKLHIQKISPPKRMAGDTSQAVCGSVGCVGCVSAG